MTISELAWRVAQLPPDKQVEAIKDVGNRLTPLEAGTFSGLLVQYQGERQEVQKLFEGGEE